MNETSSRRRRRRWRRQVGQHSRRRRNASSRRAPGRVHSTKRQLTRERLDVWIPIREEFIASRLVHVDVGHLERHRLVRFARKQNVLVTLIPRLHFLFVRRHESVSRLGSALRLGIIQLKQQASLSRPRIELLRHPVPRSSNLHRLSRLNLRVRRRVHRHVSRISRRALR